MVLLIGRMSPELISIDWNETAIVGEFTTPGGPFFDDHFLVVVFRSGQLLELPAERTDEIIPLIEKATGAKIQFGLCNVTDAASRIIFPSALAEHPVFEFYQARTGFREVLRTIKRFGVTEISKRLTREVANYIRGQ